MKASGIYEIVNVLDGKRYVGSAVNMRQRWREHRSMLRRGKHHSRYLQNAWNKHGEINFAFRIVTLCEASELIGIEQAEIESNRPAYNVCPMAGSSLGRSHSEQTRLKISQSRIGQKMPERDAEHRARLSAAQKGRSKSKEHAAALQEGRRRYSRSKEDCRRVSESLIVAYREGRHRRDRPQEYRDKIAAGLSGKSLAPEHKANVSRAMRGKKRGPYKLDPAKAEARREAGRRLAALTNQIRWGFQAQE